MNWRPWRCFLLGVFLLWPGLERIRAEGLAPEEGDEECFSEEPSSPVVPLPTGREAIIENSKEMINRLLDRLSRLSGPMRFTETSVSSGCGDRIPSTTNTIWQDGLFLRMEQNYSTGKTTYIRNRKGAFWGSDAEGYVSYNRSDLSLFGQNGRATLIRQLSELRITGHGQQGDDSYQVIEASNGGTSAAYWISGKTGALLRIESREPRGTGFCERTTTFSNFVFASIDPIYFEARPRRADKQ